MGLDFWKNRKLNLLMLGLHLCFEHVADPFGSSRRQGIVACKCTAWHLQCAAYSASEIPGVNIILRAEQAELTLRKLPSAVPSRGRPSLTYLVPFHEHFREDFRGCHPEWEVSFSRDLIPSSTSTFLTTLWCDTAFRKISTWYSSGEFYQKRILS